MATAAKKIAAPPLAPAPAPAVEKAPKETKHKLDHFAYDRKNDGTFVNVIRFGTRQEALEHAIATGWKVASGRTGTDLLALIGNS